MSAAAILAFAGLDGLGGGITDIAEAPGTPSGAPATSYAALVGRVPNPYYMPGNPPHTQSAMAPAMYRSQWSSWPLRWSAKKTYGSPQPMNGLGCAGAPCGPMPPGATCRSCGGGASGLGEFTANDAFNSIGTLVVLGGVTAVALYFFLRSSGKDDARSMGPSIDWDGLGKEWDDAARR